MKTFYQPKIYGFEPTKEVFEYLIIKYKNNENIKISEIALSEKNGIIDFWSSKYTPANSVLKPDISIYKKHLEPDNKHILNFQNTLNHRLVKTQKFDTWREENIPNEKIDLFKTDTQGYDHQVLEGAKVSLKDIKLVLVELQFNQFYESSSPFFEVIKFLYNNNFYLYNIFKKNTFKIYECDALFCNKNLLIK